MDIYRIFFQLRHIIILFILLSKFCTANTAIHGKKLSYRNRNLTFIPQDSTDDVDVTQITTALYSHNDIPVLRGVEFAFFVRFSNLTYMFFDHNRISKIEANTFSRIPMLKHLDLSHNKLLKVSTVFFLELRDLKHLQYMNLKRNPIYEVAYVIMFLVLGVDVDYDGRGPVSRLLNRRNKRVTPDDVNKENEMLRAENALQLYGCNITNGEHPGNSTCETPTKEFVVHTAVRKEEVGTSHYGSLIFNSFAAFAVLVILPVGMLVYYCASKRGRCCS